MQELDCIGARVIVVIVTNNDLANIKEKLHREEFSVQSTRITMSWSFLTKWICGSDSGSSTDGGSGV
jgi:hypothetical protein